MSLFLSIDPGNKKCGILLADINSGNVIQAGISSLNRLSDLLWMMARDYEDEWTASK